MIVQQMYVAFYKYPADLLWFGIFVSMFLASCIWTQNSLFLLGKKGVVSPNLFLWFHLCRRDAGKVASKCCNEI